MSNRTQDPEIYLDIETSHTAGHETPVVWLDLSLDMMKWEQTWFDELLASEQEKDIKGVNEASQELREFLKKLVGYIIDNELHPEALGLNHITLATLAVDLGFDVDTLNLTPWGEMHLNFFVLKRAEALKLFYEGWSDDEIAQKLQVTPGAIAKWRKEFQPYLGKANRWLLGAVRAYRYSTATIAEIRAMFPFAYSSGAPSYKYTGERYFHQGTFYKHLKRMKIPPRRQATQNPVKPKLLAIEKNFARQYELLLEMAEAQKLLGGEDWNLDENPTVELD